jgi:hypothetical protein
MIKITTAGTDPDAWKEVCMISILPESGSALAFQGFTEDITAMDWGDKDIEGVALLNGGRVVKVTPMGDESITFKVYPINAEVTAGEGAVQHFHSIVTAGSYADDSTQPIAVPNSINRRKFGIVILWAETLPSNATTVPDISKTAYRIQVVNAYMTSYKPSFDDKILSAEVTFKWAPFTKAAVGNKREESTDGTAQLPAAITTAIAF